jgi:hypothetical protein
MRRTAVIGLLCLVAGAGLFGASPALGCSIAYPTVEVDPNDPDPPDPLLVRARQDLAASTLAITGRVTRVRYLDAGGEITSGGRRYEATIRVSRVYKGATGPTTRVRGSTETSSCGFGKLNPGQRLGLLLRGKGPPWSIDITSQIASRMLERATGGRSHPPRRR